MEGATAVSSLLPEVTAFAQRHNLGAGAQEELQALVSASVLLTQKRVTVSVPCTVANLGPGIETVGLAVDIWDEFTLEYSDQFALEVYGDASSEIPRNEQHFVVVGAAAAFKEAGRPFPALHFICHHRIPFNKGLGASSAAFVGGFLAGSVLCSEELRLLSPKSAADGSPVARPGQLTRTESLADAVAYPSDRTQNTGVDALLQAAISHGWNPGNVCPAIYGALQIGINTPTGLRSHRVPVPHGLVLVLFVPDSLPEGQALPNNPVDRKAAIFNVGRAALLINCFVTEDFAKFQKASEDSLALKYINQNYPYVGDVSEAAMKAGAAGVCPCGYGPSVVALIPGRMGDVLAQSASNQLEQNVAKAMLRKAEERGVTGKILIAKPADLGAHVVAQKSSLGATDDYARIVYFQ